MSLTVTTDVFCDGPGNGRGCMEWAFGVTGPKVDSRGARRRVKTEGWVRRGGRDLCPKCAAVAADYTEGEGEQ